MLAPVKREAIPPEESAQPGVPSVMAPLTPFILPLGRQAGHAAVPESDKDKLRKIHAK